VDIVVFGATGRAGSAVVERARARGHEVTAFVRDPGMLGDVANEVRVVTGDALHADTVEKALRGREAAVSALGARHRDTTELSDAATTMIRAAGSVRLARLVVISQIGVLLTKTRPEFAHIRIEHLRVLEALRASGLSWVALAPAGIDDRPEIGRYEAVVEGRPPAWSIGRLDLAEALLDALERDDWVGHVVGVSDPASE
jgi:uncharacterized protein YbjT (DUF2867 family)